MNEVKIIIVINRNSRAQIEDLVEFMKSIDLKYEVIK